MLTTKEDLPFNTLKDHRSTPWGQIFVNPLLIDQLPTGTPVDILTEMVHINLNFRNPPNPELALLYRFPVNEAINSSIKIGGLNIIHPAWIAFYKLLNWRNGHYEGWDRKKRDWEDLYILLHYGIVNYEEIVRLIQIFTPQEIHEILLNRLNQVITQTSPPQSTQSQEVLSDTRQWGEVIIVPPLQEEINNFLQDPNKRYLWVNTQYIKI